MIRFRIERGQELVRVDNDVVAADTTDLMAHFDLDELFTGGITSYWRSDTMQKPIAVVLNSSGECLVPYEVLAKVNNQFGLLDHYAFVSIADSGKTTSSICKIKVQLSEYSNDSENPGEPTPTIIEQLTETVASANAYTDEKVGEVSEEVSRLSESVDEIQNYTYSRITGTEFNAVMYEYNNNWALIPSNDYKIYMYELQKGKTYDIYSKNGAFAFSDAKYVGNAIEIYEHTEYESVSITAKYNYLYTTRPVLVGESKLKMSGENVYNDVDVTIRDNCWLQDGIMNSANGYRCISFEMDTNKTYRIIRNNIGLISLGLNNSGWVNGYAVGDFSRYNDCKIIEYTNYKGYRHAHVFVGEMSDENMIAVLVSDNSNSVTNKRLSYENENEKTSLSFSKGSYKNDTTEPIYSEIRMRSNVLPLKGGEIIKSDIYEFNANVFDADKQFIEMSYSLSNEWVTEYTVPTNARYVTIVCRKDSNNNSINPYDLHRASRSVSVTGYTDSENKRTFNSMMMLKAQGGLNKLNRNVSSILYGYNGKLVKEGNKIKNKYGEEFVLTGIGTHSIYEYKNLYTPECMKTLTLYGINCIRISVYLSDFKAIKSDGRKVLGWLNHSDTLKPIIEQLIKVATNVGMYIILDWHSYDFTDGADVTVYTQQQEAFFEYYSNKYANQNNILYEIHNEPYRNTANQLVSSVSSCASIVRSHNSDAILICGHGSDGIRTANNVFNVLNNLNVFVSPHLYTGDQSLEFFKSEIDDGLPIFVSEWGNSSLSGDNVPNDEEAKRVFEYLHTKGVSYALWKLTYQPMSTAVLNHNITLEEYLYPYGGWEEDVLSHNGTLYFNEISKYRFGDN